jgi:hypothetical protein
LQKQTGCSTQEKAQMVFSQTQEGNKKVVIQFSSFAFRHVTTHALKNAPITFSIAGPIFMKFDTKEIY